MADPWTQYLDCCSVCSLARVWMYLKARRVLRWARRLFVIERRWQVVRPAHSRFRVIG